MSWMKRPKGVAGPPSGPGPQHFSAPQENFTQPFGSQPSAYPNYQPGSTNTPQQTWQMPLQQAQYNPAQYSQGYEQSDYINNANQVYPSPNQFNPNYTNQSYNNTQQSYQQNYFPNQGIPQQQGYVQNKTNVDSWEDNWDWGWEDTAKGHKASSQNHAMMQPSVPVPSYNNANVIEESFAPTGSWNWSTDDNKDLKERTTPVTPQQEIRDLTTQPLGNSVLDNNINVTNTIRSTSNQSAQLTEEVRSLGDRDVLQENLPSLAIGKRFHADNLTPQWSIESQMSQESSDGLHTQSESTYRSENQSRNSSKDSPVPNNDNSNFLYSHSLLDETPTLKQSTEQSNLVENLESSSNNIEIQDSLTNSLQEMSIRNCENITSNTLKSNKDIGSKDDQSRINKLNNMPPQPSLLPTNIHSSSDVSTSSPDVPLATPPVAVMPAPPISSVPLLPPTDFTSSTSQNPFKNTGPFNHRCTPKGATVLSSSQPFSPPVSATNLISPAVVNKVSQYNRVPVGFGANLETTPDNSERPDQPQVSGFRLKPPLQQMPDNLEVAPKNDRNEYLQTAHLSTSDYGDNTDFGGNVPPPGLRRLVVGQQESEYTQNLNISGDDPPPGFTRMVPGQQTETDHAYSQNSDNYMDRHIDGQTMDGTGRPYRQADGQQTPDNYSQPPTTRVNERRPICLDRMVPGELSNVEYSQYQGAYTTSNEERVVTGVDRDYHNPNDTVPSDIREQNVDGSDYMEHSPRNAPRNIIGAREVNNETSDYSAAPENQREITMEGENLQDLSIISSTDLTFSREQIMDGADVNVIDGGTDRKTDASDSIDHAAPDSRRQSINRTNTSGEDSERDRQYKASPRHDREKHRTPKDRDRDRDNRYAREDRKYDKDLDRWPRDDKKLDKSGKDRKKDRDKRGRDENPDARRYRRSTRSHRYETEDTDYYSDRERERVRHHREGSYTSSKPPRPDEQDRRYRDSQERRRYNTIERDKRLERYEEDRERSTRSRRGERYERKYRDIDPTRKYGNLHREREEEERRRVVTFSDDAKPIDSSREERGEREAWSGGSREGRRTDEEGGERRRRGGRHDREHYYEGYGVGGQSALRDPYVYQYYEQLRLTNPAAYMEVYNKLMAGLPLPPPPPDYRAALQHHHYAPLYEGYGGSGYEARAEGRGSVHSGRSSANGLKGTDTYYGSYRRGLAAHGVHGAGSLRDAHSLRTDLSDRDLNTDMSLNLHLEESTVRSERMTPFKFSTAHIKGSIGSRHLVVVRPSYPVDGAPATVQVLSVSAALAHDPGASELRASPGPLVRGVTHKRSVLEYCLGRTRSAERLAPRDPVGYVLVWEFLALLLRQNGSVVGSDIAELLMKNTQEYQYTSPGVNMTQHDESSGRRSSDDLELEPRTSTPDLPQPSPPELTTQEKLDKLREHLTFGKRQEALEWAMSCALWSHALALSAHGDRRQRAHVAARFVAALPAADPLHSLYVALAGQQPPAATCLRSERWGDWRPHAAIVLSNPTNKPEQDQRTLTQLGDSLSRRGLVYSAQFCYLCAGVGVARHPLAPLSAPPHPSSSHAPPRLALLLADSRADRLPDLATNQAILATEIYEYALSLAVPDYVITELQVYKFLLACRLCDCGEYERALAYVEAASRAVVRAPREYHPRLLAQLADLADRLKYVDPALQEEPGASGEEGGASGGSAEPSPRHQQWLHDVTTVAQALQAESANAPVTSPQHTFQPAPEQEHPAPTDLTAQTHYGWPEQMNSHQTGEPGAPEYGQQYADYGQQYAEPAHQPAAPAEPAQYEWPPPAEPQPYWQPEPYVDREGEGSGAGYAEEARPTITMPGSAPTRPALYADYEDDRPDSAHQRDRATDTPPASATKREEGSKEERKGKTEGKGKSGGGGGWLGGLFRFNLRAPNQMILPDDKNPPIVWDAERKRWRNREGDDGDEGARPPPPPPTMADLAPAHQRVAAPPQTAGAPGAPGVPPAPDAPTSNLFKMQKARHIKKSYVDVFNPSGAATRPLPPVSEVLGPAPPAPPATYFVPQDSPSQGGMYGGTRDGLYPDT